MWLYQCKEWSREYKNAWVVESFPKIIDDYAGWTFTTVDDIDNDGDTETIASSYGGYEGKFRNDIYVWDLEAPYLLSTMHWPTFHHDVQRTGMYGYPLCSGLLGDLNGNGCIDPEDPSMAFDMYIGTVPASPCADLNGDLAITPADALIIQGMVDSCTDCTPFGECSATQRGYYCSSGTLVPSGLCSGSGGSPLIMKAPREQAG